MRAGQIEQGGSTLTQQLVKSYFLDSRRTLRRKAEEAVMAIILESRFEKADIMNAYINEIYLGQDGRRAVHGFGLASQFYFGKPLVGARPAGDRAARRDRARTVVLRPATTPGAHARARRNLVLKLLAAQGVDAEAEDAERAAQEAAGLADAETPGLELLPGVSRPRASPVDAATTKEEDLTEAGLVVFTTLDPLLQERARKALAGGARRGSRRAGRKAREGLAGCRRRDDAADRRGASVVVGGANASFDGFNRALDARRPIGSIAKPLVYLARAGAVARTRPLRAVADEPVELKLPNGQTWKPENFTKETQRHRCRWCARSRSR